MLPETLQPYAGQTAAVATSLLWTATALFFTAGIRRVGPTLVNAARIAFAILLLGVTHRLLTGHWIPDANWKQAICLGASGVIGLSIGDQALLTAFVDIGTRLAMLVMTTAPLMAATLGFVFLGERLTAISLVGMALTIGGVAWVVLERPSGAQTGVARRKTRGVALATLAALCQASGLLLSKQGMGHGWLPPDQHLGPQAATLIRMSFAGLGMIPILASHGVWERRKRAAGIIPSRVGQPSAGLLFALCGAVTGPFLGVWMSLTAASLIPLGLSQTLCSLAPIFLLPCAAVLYKERVTLRAAVGAVIAVGGSALLFVRAG